MGNKRTIEVIETKDGSKSLFYKELNETYHSIHGAVAESKHVFIKEGLIFSQNMHQNLAVLEVGFGTGLNAMLTLEMSIRKELEINYTTIEPYPLSIDIINELNYYNLFSKDLENDLKILHECKWHEDIKIGDFFYFNKLETPLEAITFNQQFNIIYFDAFAPGKQSEMWEQESLIRVYDALEEGGILVTYCAKGQFRRNLESIGFKVDRIPGPPGKREMIRATK